jgi:hypothetical protein
MPTWANAHLSDPEEVGQFLERWWNTLSGVLGEAT